MATIQKAPTAPKKALAPPAPAARPVVTSPMRPPPRVAPAAPSAAQQAIAASATVEAPVKRGPGRPPGSKNKAAPAADMPAATITASRAAPLVARAAPAPATAPKAPPDNPAILATVESLKATVLEQNELIAKLQARDKNVRSLSDLLDGAENGLKDTDWRLPWHGVTIPVHHFDRKRDGLELRTDLQPFDALFVIPRMTDPRGHGSMARTMGQMGLWIQREDGDYEILEYVLSEAEIQTIRADG